MNLPTTVRTTNNTAHVGVVDVEVGRGNLQKSSRRENSGHGGFHVDG